MKEENLDKARKILDEIKRIDEMFIKDVDGKNIYSLELELKKNRSHCYTNSESITKIIDIMRININNQFKEELINKRNALLVELNTL